MKTINSQPIDAQSKPRLGLKLALLSLAGFLIVFVGGWVVDIFASLVERKAEQTEITSQSQTIVIDPKLESDLAKVLDLDNPQNLADLKDPFIDHSGISLTSNSAVVSAAKNGVAAQPRAASQNNKTAVAQVPQTKTQPEQKTNIIQTLSPTNPVVIDNGDTLSRMLKRDENIRNGVPVGEESEVFAIEDLLPVGSVSGGNGQDEIMFYSQSIDRTYSFPVGTRFFDGTLSGIRKEGAVFSFDSTNEVKLKSWVRSIQPRSTANTATLGNPKQTGN